MNTQLFSEGSLATRYTILYFVVDCIWSPWNEWTSCSETCGDGSRSKERLVVQESANNGTPCYGQPIKNKSCKIIDCPSMLLTISLNIF